jgi:hypothetical protein
MTATAKLDLLDEFSECPVSKVDRSLDKKTATGSFGSRVASRLADFVAVKPTPNLRCREAAIHRYRLPAISENS